MAPAVVPAASGAADHRYRWVVAIPIRRDAPDPIRYPRLYQDVGASLFPGRNRYRSAGDAPMLWYPKGRRIGSGASLRTFVARTVRYGFRGTARRLRPHHGDHPPPRIVFQSSRRIVQDPRHAQLKIQHRQPADGYRAEVEAVLEAGQAEPVALGAVAAPEAVTLVEQGSRQKSQG